MPIQYICGYKIHVHNLYKAEHLHIYIYTYICIDRYLRCRYRYKMYIKIKITHCPSSLRSSSRSNWLKMQLDRLDLGKNPDNYAHGSYGTK